MNTSELLGQFIQESRECLERIGQRLLEVEKAPQDSELLNDLFRQVHTLKGNCGLFDFKPLEQVVHAGEDLLDKVRHGDLAYGPDIADALLEAMDYTAELVDRIESQGELSAETGARSQVLAQALRRHLQPNAATPSGSPSAPAVRQAAAPVAAAPTPSEWVSQHVPAHWLGKPVVALRYQPEPECFFKGEDPWHLACTTPGLQHLTVHPRTPWPAPEQLDCYQCNLELVVVSDAPRAYVEEHYRYVPEQVALEDLSLLAKPQATAAAAEDGTAARAAWVQRRLAQIWDEQLGVLSRPGTAAGTVAACRTVFSHLLALQQPPQAALQSELQQLPEGMEALRHWAQRHAPGIASAGASSLLETTSTAGSAAPLGAGRGGAVAEESSDRGHKVLKVGQDKVDRLMELIGEMVVAKNALPYLAVRAEAQYQQRELAREIKAQYAVINRIAEDMQHAIMQVRMLPVGTIFQRFGRLVRDLSRKLGKDVALVIEGEDTEADKNVIESLADPLIHIVRNSLDHGLETPEQRRAAGKAPQGTLRVAAHQEGDRVILDITDDGAGIDADKVRRKAVERGLIPADRAATLSDAEAHQLVFLPGFSTAEAVSDLSGRGVGMDVVRTAVERINGHVELSSQAGRGTLVRLTLPLSMAVTNVMMIEAGGQRFGVPMDLIVETVRVPAEDIHSFKQARTTVLRGRIVPLRALGELLQVDAPPRPNEDGELAVLVVRFGQENIGLLVDDFHGTSDIILKPLEGVLTGLTGFAGTALMGDGTVLMILNPKELV